MNVLHTLQFAAATHLEDVGVVDGRTETRVASLLQELVEPTTSLVLGSTGRVIDLVRDRESDPEGNPLVVIRNDVLRRRRAHTGVQVRLVHLLGGLKGVPAKVDLKSHTG